MCLLTVACRSVPPMRTMEPRQSYIKTLALYKYNMKCESNFPPFLSGR